MKITANQLTILRIALLPIPYFLLYGGTASKMIALAAFAILGLTDYLDGLMARRDGVTKLGKLLDPIADKIFIAVVLLPIVDMGILPLWVIFPVFLREFLVTELRNSLSAVNQELKVTEIAKIKTTIQMTGAGLILMTHTFPDKTVSAAFLAGALLATIVLGIGLYWKNIVISQRMKWAAGLLSLALAVLVLFKTDQVILIYGLIMALITLVSGWNYVIKGVPASIKQGPLALSRAILALLFPSVTLAFLGLDKGITPYLIIIISLEFATQGLDIWVKQTREKDFSWMKSLVIFPLAILVFFIIFLTKDLLPAVDAFILFVFYLIILYTFSDLWLHRKFIKEILNTG